MTTYTDVFGGATTPATPSSYGALNFSASTTLLWPFDSSGGSYLYALNDITPSAGSLVLTLPDASAVSKGETAIFQNKGAYSVELRDPGGSTVATISASTVVLIYLADNSDADGSWEVVQLGTGSSAVDAASLVGYGIKASGSTLNQSHPVTAAASGITVTTTYRAKLINFTGGVDTFAFSPVATLGDDFFTLIRNSGTGTLTLNPDSSETIDGQTTLEVQPGESLLVVCSGSALYTVGYGRSILYNFTQLTKDVSAGGSFTLTANEAANKLLTFTGNPAGNVTVVVPSTVAVYYILNSLSTAKSVTVKTAAGTGVAVAQSQRVIAISDATNVYSAQSVSASTSVQVVDGSAAAPSLAFASTTNTGLYKYGADGIGITVAGSPVFTADSTSAALLINWTAAGVTCADGGTFTTIDINGGTVDGVVIGGSSAAAGSFTTLTTSGNVTLGDATTDTVTVNGQLTQTGSSSGAALTAYIKNTSNTASSDARYLIQTGGTSGGDAYVGFYDGTTLLSVGKKGNDSGIHLGSNGPSGTTRMYVGSSNTLINSTTARANFDNSTTSPRFQVEGLSLSGSGGALVRNSADSGGPTLFFGKTRGAVVGATTVVQSGDTLGEIRFQGSDGTEFAGGAWIAAFVDGTPGANDMPGRLAFYTAADGSTSATEAARIDSSQRLLVGVTSATTNGGKIETSDGITFPATQSACSNANTLDDYEEGTWTPSMKDGSGNAATLTSSTGYYTKIGNLVTASGTLVVQRGAMTVTNLNLQGLPFTSNNVTATPALNVGYFAGLNSNVVMLAGYLGANATYAYFQKLSAAGAGMSALTYTDIPTASDATFYFTISYLAAN